MIKHVNEIKLTRNDAWGKLFNLCSEYYLKSIDETITEDERDEYFEKWKQARLNLELGRFDIYDFGPHPVKQDKQESEEITELDEDIMQIRIMAHSALGANCEEIDTMLYNLQVKLQDYNITKTK